MQIKKKFIKNNAVDGAKLLLLNDQSVRALDASDNVVELMKLDVSGDLRMLVLPKASVDPTHAEHLARKSYVDAEVAGALSSANSYTDSQIAATVGAAPELLNTLQELSAALGDDANFATTIANQISSLDGRLDTLEGAEGVAGSVKQNITDRLAPSIARRQIYVDLAAKGGWHLPSETPDYVADGSIYRPFSTIQAAINHGYTSLDDLTYGLPNADHDFVVIVKSSGNMQTGNNANPVNIIIDPSAIRVAAGKPALSAPGGKMTLMFEEGLIGGIVPLKLVGTITISGANTTRIKLKNIYIEAPNFSSSNPPTVLTINGTAGRHYFDNCTLNGKTVFQGAWARWHEFNNGANYGYQLGGSSTGSVTSQNTICDAVTTVNTGLMYFLNSDRIHSVVHNAGSLMMTRSALGNSAGVVSSASAPGVLFLRDVNFFTGAAYAAFSKTGSAPYYLNNVMRSSASDALSGTRIAWGATSSDAKFVAAQAGDWSSLVGGETSVKVALDELKANVKSLNGGLSAIGAGKESFILSASDISNGYIDLSVAAIMAHSLNAWVDRLGIFEGSDYSLTNTGSAVRLVFAGSLLPGADEALAEGDVIRVSYIVS